MWYRQTMEYYSAIRKNEIISFAATWMDLQIIILSEVTQTEKYHDTPYMQNLKRNNTIKLTYKIETDPQP